MPCFACCSESSRSSRQLLDGGSVAGEGRATHVAHLVAVEAARSMHRGAVVPDDEIVLLPGVRMDELALCGVLGQVTQEGPRLRNRPSLDRARMGRQEQRLASGLWMNT